MASSYGHLPFHLQVELNPDKHLAWYHTDELCGSTLHGLATTLERFVTDNRVDEGLRQLRRCIDARKQEAERRTHPDPQHNVLIRALEHFYREYMGLAALNESAKRSVKIRSLGGGRFRILVGHPAPSPLVSSMRLQPVLTRRVRLHLQRPVDRHSRSRSHSHSHSHSRSRSRRHRHTHRHSSHRHSSHRHSSHRHSSHRHSSRSSRSNSKKSEKSTSLEKNIRNAMNTPFPNSY